VNSSLAGPLMAVARRWISLLVGMLTGLFHWIANEDGGRSQRPLESRER